MNERRPRFYIESTYRPNNSHQIKGSVAIGNGSIPAQFLSNIERPSNFLFALRGNPNLKRIMNMRSYELTYSAQLKKNKYGLNGSLRQKYKLSRLILLCRKRYDYSIIRKRQSQHGKN